MENLAIQKSSWQRPPVLIDPDMEGVRWMRKILHNDKLTNIDMFTRLDNISHQMIIMIYYIFHSYISFAHCKN